MVKSLFLFASVFIGGALFSQTLQFSQVKLVSTSETVPAGTVWKVEGANYSFQIASTAMTSSTSITTTTADYTWILNGQTQNVFASRSRSANYGSSNLIWEKKWPIWLPAGSTVEAGTGVHSLSVIEFTVIP
jgi:hypothetical protein